MNKHNITTLVFLMLLSLGFGSCAKDYGDDISNIDTQVDNLHKTDAELRALIEQHVRDLREQLGQDLSSEQQEQQDIINQRLGAIATTISGKLAVVENKMANDLPQKESALNSKISDVEGKILAMEAMLEGKLSDLETQIDQAQAAGDQETVEKLNAYKNRMTAVLQYFDDLEDETGTWQSRLDAAQLEDHAAEYADLQAKLNSLSNFDITTLYQDVETFLSNFQETKLEELTSEQLAFLESTFATINSTYSWMKSNYEQMEDRLNDLETLVNNAISDLETAADELGTADTDFSRLDEALSYEGKAGDLEDMVAELEDLISTAETLIDDAGSAVQRAEDALNEIFTASGRESDMEDPFNFYNEFDSAAQDLVDHMNTVASEYPWVFDGASWSWSF